MGFRARLAEGKGVGALGDGKATWRMVEAVGTSIQPVRVAPASHRVGAVARGRMRPPAVNRSRQTAEKPTDGIGVNLIRLTT